MNFEVKKELEKWDGRVIFDARFKEDSKAPLHLLDQALQKSLEKFVTIAANSEALVYKIGRYMVSKRVKNEDITFVDGKIVQSYIGDDSKEWKKKERVDEFFITFGEDFKNKWVIMPNLCFGMSISLALYFHSQFKKHFATGIIFFAEGADNLTEDLCLNIEDPNLYEFPEKKYKKKKRILPADEW